MDLNLSFNFRNKGYTCNTYIDSSEYPCYVFVILLDDELIAEFGDEISIKTDGFLLLPKRDDHRELVALRQAIFDAIKNTPPFVAVKRRMMLLHPTPTKPSGKTGLTNTDA